MDTKTSSSEINLSSSVWTCYNELFLQPVSCSSLSNCCILFCCVHTTAVTAVSSFISVTTPAISPPAQRDCQWYYYYIISNVSIPVAAAALLILHIPFQIQLFYYLPLSLNVLFITPKLNVALCTFTTTLYLLESGGVEQEKYIKMEKIPVFVNTCLNMFYKMYFQPIWPNTFLHQHVCENMYLVCQVTPPCLSTCC